MATGILPHVVNRSGRLFPVYQPEEVLVHSPHGVIRSRTILVHSPAVNSPIHGLQAHPLESKAYHIPAEQQEMIYHHHPAEHAEQDVVYHHLPAEQQAHLMESNAYHIPAEQEMVNHYHHLAAENESNAYSIPSEHESKAYNIPSAEQEMPFHLNHPSEELVMELKIPPTVIAATFGDVSGQQLQLASCLARYEVQQERFLIRGRSIEELQEAKAAIAHAMAAYGYILKVEGEHGDEMFGGDGENAQEHFG
eukprot:CAMPEP_0181324786 /NCGR_PEP_ID=MMETSP1101-20121128/20559_1 /TAXON_ID=46948 /ORGANISM="Rhodomonas abbreviata, Strain Caron Lab Isolate" /LENGTH=250 /DNA_ID=CAMNT_0023433013 /DNA_START=33 /DNA_END=781 /DNA_ORIENTATION=+